MQFIARGVEQGETEREAGFVPTPVTLVITLRLTDGAPREHGEHGKFHHMTAFPKRVVKLLNVRLRHCGKQPAHERLKINGRVPGRISVTGRGKDDAHPDEQWQPVDEKFLELRHAAG